jgi:hypothetical protein
MLSILAVFLVARRILRATFHPYLLPPLREQWKCKPQSSRSKALGASLGVLRGAVVAVALALMGFNVGILQHAGHLRSLPPAGESGAIRQAEAIMDLLVGRYTRDAGPTTRLLVDWTLHPEPEKFEALLNGPFADRVKSSDELRALVGNREFKALVDGRRTAEMVTHPAFLRVVSFAVRELRNEESMVLSEAGG